MKTLRLIAYIFGGIFGSILAFKVTVFVIVIVGVMLGYGHDPRSLESVGNIVALISVYLINRGLWKGYHSKNQASAS